MTNAAMVEFSERLRKACKNNPHLPRENDGLYSHLARQLGVKPQAVRKYFNAEARPRSPKMSALAKLVNADESWLALGVGDDSVTNKMRTVQSVVGNNASNLVYGLMGINGHKCIISDGANGVDLICERYGSQSKIGVTSGVTNKEGVKIAKIKDTYTQHLNLVVFKTGKISVDILVIPPDVIETLEMNVKSGGLEIPLDYQDGKYFIEGIEIRKLEDTSFL